VKIAIVGLGYVGIQLAISLGRKYDTIGFDLDERKLASYREGVDPTGEISQTQFAQARRLVFADDPAGIAGCDVYIVAVPTPIDDAKRPDFRPLVAASRTVGSVMSRGSLVIYESTVYPGATEEVCVRELEAVSGLKWLDDFHVGYSPERINPGDREHTLEKIVKVVSADDADSLETVKRLYGSIVEAGIHVAPSLRVAEAAKVIENTQRDLNIALVNELAVIFDRMGIETRDVLEAARTKWNFLPFMPGLVGGHCIGVDPYYLTHKAQELGYHPEVILAGRRINDGMGKFVAEKTIKTMLAFGCELRMARVNVFGFSFKENCPDIRNTQVIEIVRELRSYGVSVGVFDPVADVDEALDEYGEQLIGDGELLACDAVVLAVAHDVLLDSGLDGLLATLRTPGVFIDVKSRYSQQVLAAHGFGYWSL
jgi:UDP-N-acetyl-D-galactosamine dehydrogenase